MSVQELERIIPVYEVDEIMDSLPAEDAAYTDHYQPRYEDPQALRDAIHEVQSTETVTQPRHVDNLQHRLTDLVEGRITEPAITTGRCAEEVSLQVPIERMVQYGLRNIAIVRNAIGKAIYMWRSRGQAVKPRSAEHEQLPDGRRVPSHMGEGVNGTDPDEREPDPTRMVAMGVQSRDIEAGLTEAAGEHVPAAHEALLTPYEMASTYIDPETGKKYLLSTDMPWIGKRTNSLDGPHVAMLEGIANPIGVKIGADSDAAHIAGLQQRLNPDNIPGKLTFMLRIGRENRNELQSVVTAIAEHAPNAVIMYDIHGTTRNVDGRKIRAVSDIVEDVAMVSEACREAGLKLHGVHLETVMDDDRLECVATPDQIPTHPGGVDPQLNPAQLDDVLRRIKPYLLRPTKDELRARAKELRGTRSEDECQRIRDMAGDDRYALIDDTTSPLIIPSYGNSTMARI